MLPVAFEIIGMLGRPVRIRGSCFTRLPNPTAERPCSLSINVLYRLLETFATTIENLTPLSQILDNWRNAKTIWPRQHFYEKHDISISAKEFLHDLLDSCTEYLLSRPSHSIHSVISAHLTAVLDHLNSPESEFDNDFAEFTRRSDYAADFVRTYSNEVLPTVISKGPLASKQMSQKDSRGSRDVDQLGMTEVDLDELQREGLERKTVWCTLVIRMLCWLLLHDFHPDDVNIVPSELKGSQMPVYIG